MCCTTLPCEFFFDGICEVDCTIQGYIINVISFCRHHGGRKERDELEKRKCNWQKIIKFQI